MSDETQTNRRLPSWAVELVRRVDACERDIRTLQRENERQATRERQEMHYRTLFGESSDKQGVVQKVNSLWAMRSGLVWAGRILGSALLLGAGTLLVKLLIAQANNG